MDLQAIRENLRQNKYQSREDFLADVNQIVENCSLYNGPKSPLTAASQRMLQKCVDCLAEKEERLMRLEKAINPLLDDDDQVALSFIFEKLLNEKLKNMRESNVFKKPVNKKQFKDYYTVIRKPMDLETISKKIAGTFETPLHRHYLQRLIKFLAYRFQRTNIIRVRTLFRMWH